MFILRSIVSKTLWSKV